MFCYFPLFLFFLGLTNPSTSSQYLQDFCTEILLTLLSVLCSVFVSVINPKVCETSKIKDFLDRRPTDGGEVVSVGPTPGRHVLPEVSRSPLLSLAESAPGAERNWSIEKSMNLIGN
jgi:hypothetical protein